MQITAVTVVVDQANSTDVNIIICQVCIYRFDHQVMLMWRAFCVDLLQQEPFWLQTSAPMHSSSSNRSVPLYRQLKQQTHYSEGGSCGTEIGSLRTATAPQSHPCTCTSLEAAMELCVNLHNVLNIECFPYWLQLLCVLQSFILWSIRPENRFLD